MKGVIFDLRTMARSASTWRFARSIAMLVFLPLVSGAEVLPGFRSKKDEPMVDVAKACPTIVIGLRYATSQNVTGYPIYPPGARCLVRQSVAAKLERAQTWLKPFGLRLKIWDAYRPKWAHDILWRSVQNGEFVGNPEKGGSLHTYGAAVDATLVDRYGRELRMPTDFDDFTAASSMYYRGPDLSVAKNLRTLQGAMKVGGFRGMRDEWWHFIAEDCHMFTPVDVALVAE